MGPFAIIGHILSEQFLGTCEAIGKMFQISRSHKGAAGMRSVLTFEKVVWIVDARVER
jgi:hypothetical protein